MTLQEARKVIGLNIHNLNGSMQMAVATIMDALEEKAEIIGYLQPSEDLAKKPPLGVVPRFIWNKRRMKELKAAIARFEEAHYPVPEEFIKELQDLKEKEEE